MIMLLLLQTPPPALEQKLPVRQLLGKELKSTNGPMTTQMPDPAAWDRQPRDVSWDLRRSARKGPSIPALEVPIEKGTLVQVSDQVQNPAGWKAYKVEVPPKAVLHARLRSLHEGWFLVRTANKWGQMEEGMLQNRIPKGNPEATYKNPKDEVRTVFFIVDTTTLMPDYENYTLEFSFK